MKEKLELYQIASYLPYQLKLFCDSNSQIYNVFGYVKDSLLTSTLQKPSVDEMFHTAIFAMKPILHPLSDLSKEIDYKGKKIIPLIEILKKVSLLNLENCNFEYSKGYRYLFVNAFLNGRLKDAIIFDGNVFKMVDNNGDFDVLNPQREAIEMLNEFNFDWKYDLIGKGIAIDINTLNP